MRNAIFKLSTVASLFAVSAIAYAAPPTAELKVIGKIEAPICTVNAPDNGTYDFGRISPTLVKPTATTTLTPMTKTWTVACDADTYLSFSVVDQREASASLVNATAFGLGNVNGTGKIGYYNVAMSGGTVDGAATQHFTVVSGSGSFYTYNTVNVTKGYNMGWGTGTNTLKSGKVFTSNLTVTPVLASAATMGGAITSTVDLDGLITMRFAFGI